MYSNFPSIPDGIQFSSLFIVVIVDCTYFVRYIYKMTFLYGHDWRDKARYKQKNVSVQNGIIKTKDISLFFKKKGTICDFAIISCQCIFIKENTYLSHS